MGTSSKKRLDKEILSLSREINALNNKNRLTLLGLLYLESVRSFTDMANETKIDSNKLAYHLKVLINTKLIFKKNDKYSLTNEGEEILRNIGFVEEIKELVEPKPLTKPIVRTDIQYPDVSDSIKKIINPIQWNQHKNNYFIQLSRLQYRRALTEERENYFKEIKSSKECLQNKTYVDPDTYKSSREVFKKINTSYI